MATYADQFYVAVFDGTQDTVAATWINLGGTQRVAAGVAGDDVGAWLTSITTTGCTVNVTARFTGTVTLTIKTT